MPSVIGSTSVRRGLHRRRPAARCHVRGARTHSDHLGRPDRAVRSRARSPLSRGPGQRRRGRRRVGLPAHLITATTGSAAAAEREGGLCETQGLLGSMAALASILVGAAPARVPRRRPQRSRAGSTSRPARSRRTAWLHCRADRQGQAGPMGGPRGSERARRSQQGGGRDERRQHEQSLPAGCPRWLRGQGRRGIWSVSSRWPARSIKQQDSWSG